MSYFVGQEVVTHRERALWSMSYAGGMVQPERAGADTRVIYAFLRRALQLGTAQHPYRGPALYDEGDLTYTNETTGEVDAFWGLEQIARSGDVVYAGRFLG